MDRSTLLTTLKGLEPKLRTYGVSGLYLYGSYARNEFGPGSDIDVFVDATDEQFFSLSPFAGAYETIRQAIPDHQIDYGTRGGLSPYIRSTIEREAIRVF